jgi:hypothetical protein
MSFGLHDLAAAAVGVLPVHSQPRGLDQLHRGVPGVAHPEQAGPADSCRLTAEATAGQNLVLIASMAKRPIASAATISTATSVSLRL